MRFPKKKQLLLLIGCTILLVFFFKYGYTISKGFDRDQLASINIQDVFIPPHANQIHVSHNKLSIGEEDPIANNKLTEKQQVPIRQNRRLIAFDSGGFGPVERGITKCRDGTEIEVTDDSSKLATADFAYYHMQVPPRREKNGENSKRVYSMVYTLESEPHSYGGDSWKNADFRMWYNLDGSFPEPATYFDVKMHLADLLASPSVEFENKTNEAPIVWIVSNCNAFNGREKYMAELMKLVKVDSYGGCLKNKHSHTSQRMSGNIDLFTKYKFVIAIENSNCVDYVTEKLVHAIASGSIPIVAGKDNKPDYLKFLPRHSYINIYDYTSPQQLANHIKAIAANKTLYESYLPFKRNPYSKAFLKNLELHELIKVAEKVLSPSEKFFSELVTKEKSENKICKIARYILDTKDDVKEKEIEKRQANRPSVTEACLPSGNLFHDLAVSFMKAMSTSEDSVKALNSTSVQV